jgi:hypothetical protein
MGKVAYLRSVFSIVEKIIHIEMSAQGRGVIENYLDSAEADDFAEKARYAIYRYTQLDLPSLEDIRKKNKTDQLDEMDHLILKMEHESKQLSLHGG